MSCNSIDILNENFKTFNKKIIKPSWKTITITNRDENRNV